MSQRKHPPSDSVRPARPRRRQRAQDEGSFAPEHLEPVFSPEAIALVERFAEDQPFPLDPFQIESARHLADGRSVLVAAPTGTGKTVIAEFGIWQARRNGMRAIYTAPLKALSNQKFRDLRERYGEAEVGLLTGDIVTNPRAPVVVMTTEIYRNMLLEGSRVAQLSASDEARLLVEGGREAEDNGLAADDIAELARRAALDEQLSTVGCVVFDELHYLSDPFRGPVWEEAIIHSPAHVTFVGLSATVSNADELRRWIESVHGPIALVFHDERAVPLEHYFYLDGQLHLVMNAEGQRVERFPDIGGEAKAARMRGRRRFTYGPPPEANGAQTEAREETPPEREAPEPGEVITALREAGLLPCIYFLPGRKAVELAAESAMGHLLVGKEDRARLSAEVHKWVAALPKEDQKLDQVQRLVALLPRGLAFHHAGLLPGLKVMVETLFQRGELRAVFATDTLAMGINMPARSVVLGSLSKFDGTQMRLYTPNEYQQATGRAGRRGMDERGAAILLYSPWDAFEPSFRALTGPLLPVTSAFTIRYNTVLNLWHPGDIRRLRLAVAASFREFQRRSVSASFGVSRRGQGRGRADAAEKSQRSPYALSKIAAEELYGTIAVLRTLGYIGRDDELTVKGRILRGIFHPAGMILTELLVSGALNGFSPSELAEVVSWFTYDDDRPLRNYARLPHRLFQIRREVFATEVRVLTLEQEEGLDLSPRIADQFHSIALNWSNGFTISGLLRRVDLAEGDLLVVLNQTIDLLQQLQSALGQTLDARELWREALAEGSRKARALAQLRASLDALRPALGMAWRGMMRGSVAQSRAIPSVATPTLPDLPPLAMAENDDEDLQRQERDEDEPVEREI